MRKVFFFGLMLSQFYDTRVWQNFLFSSFFGVAWVVGIVSGETCCSTLPSLPFFDEATAVGWQRGKVNSDKKISHVWLTFEIWLMAV